MQAGFELCAAWLLLSLLPLQEGEWSPPKAAGEAESFVWCQGTRWWWQPLVRSRQGVMLARASHCQGL